MIILRRHVRLNLVKLYEIVCQLRPKAIDTFMLSVKILASLAFSECDSRSNYFVSDREYRRRIRMQKHVSVYFLTLPKLVEKNIYSITAIKHISFVYF